MIRATIVFKRPDVGTRLVEEGLLFGLGCEHRLARRALPVVPCQHIGIQACAARHLAAGVFECVELAQLLLDERFEERAARGLAHGPFEQNS